MKKVFSFGIIAAAALAACTSESNIQEIEKQPAGIVFAPALDNLLTSRATQTFTTDLQAFSVNAFLDQEGNVSKYIDNAIVNKQEDNSWSTATTYIWPSSGNMSFFAYSFGSTSTGNSKLVEVSTPTVAEYKEGACPVINYKECSTDPKAQFDMLYATSNETCEVASKKAVGINFKHALSQIMFKVRNTNENWVVTVADIQIVNVKSSGVFTFPKKSTVIGEAAEGSWEASKPLRRYITSISRKSDIKKETGDVAWENALFLIPQTSTQWNPQDKNSYETGTYFLISCRISTKDGILLWPTNNEDVRNVAIPVALNWEKGKRYTYTFEFGEGAGYIPPMETGEGEVIIPENGGDETLGKIRFNVAVDDEYSTSNVNQSVKL